MGAFPYNRLVKLYRCEKEKNLMSIKTQKRLRIIPIINILTMFAWIKMCHVKQIKSSDFIKELIKMFGLFFLITMIRVSVSFIFKNSVLDNVITCISIYLYFLSMSCVSVKAQEKILNENG